jgi:hypothetical protein
MQIPPFPTDLLQPAFPSEQITSPRTLSQIQLVSGCPTLINTFLPPVTARPLVRRAGIDPNVYLTSLGSLWSAFTASPGTSLAAEISNFEANNQPTGIDSEAFRASVTAVMSGQYCF